MHRWGFMNCCLIWQSRPSVFYIVNAGNNHKSDRVSGQHNSRIRTPGFFFGRQGSPLGLLFWNAKLWFFWRIGGCIGNGVAAMTLSLDAPSQKIKKNKSQGRFEMIGGGNWRRVFAVAASPHSNCLQASLDNFSPTTLLELKLTII